MCRGCGLRYTGRQGPGGPYRRGEDRPAGPTLPRHQHQDSDQDQGVQGVQGRSKEEDQGDPWDLKGLSHKMELAFDDTHGY
jgi:hypothetical protein